MSVFSRPILYLKTDPRLCHSLPKDRCHVSHKPDSELTNSNLSFFSSAKFLPEDRAATELTSAQGSRFYYYNPKAEVLSCSEPETNCDFTDIYLSPHCGVVVTQCQVLCVDPCFPARTISSRTKVGSGSIMVYFLLNRISIRRQSPTELPSALRQRTCHPLS